MCCHELWFAPTLSPAHVTPMHRCVVPFFHVVRQFCNMNRLHTLPYLFVVSFVFSFSLWSHDKPRLLMLLNYYLDSMKMLGALGVRSLICTRAVLHRSPSYPILHRLLHRVDRYSISHPASAKGALKTGCKMMPMNKSDWHNSCYEQAIVRLLPKSNPDE